MSWLSENNPFGDGSGSTATGADPNTFTPGYWATIKSSNPTYYNSIKQFDPAFQAEQKAASDAAAAAGTASATSAAAAVNPVTQADSASAALAKLLSGFGGVPGGANFVPGSLDDSAIESVYGAQRGKAQDYIGNLLKRGVITDSGSKAGISALDTQAPKVRTKLNDIGNLLLEQERGKVRGIYNEGSQAAGSVTAGSDFDPTPYVSRAQQDVSSFGSGLADAIAGQVGGDLFDTSGVSSAVGAPSSGQANLDFDPYAVSGGKLPYGSTDDVSGAPADKKRRTTVF